MESMAGEYESRIFGIKNNDEFVAIANEVFQFQYHNNVVYKQWCDRLGVNVASSLAITQIPYLQVSLERLTPCSGQYLIVVVLLQIKLSFLLDVPQDMLIVMDLQ